MSGSSQRPKRLRRKSEREQFAVFREPTPAAVLRRIGAHNALDARLAPIDRWLWRWAASIGSGLPTATDELPRVRFPPLAPDDARQTDQIIDAAPYRWDSFLHCWYRSEKSAEQIGELLGIGRTAVYQEHKIVLGYLLGQFRAADISVPRYPGL